MVKNVWGDNKTITYDIAQVHQMVLGSSHIKVSEITDVINVPKERVCQIFSQDQKRVLMNN